MKKHIENLCRTAQYKRHALTPIRKYLTLFLCLNAGGRVGGGGRGKGSNKMHHWGNYQDFLKYGGGVHSLITIK